MGVGSSRPKEKYTVSAVKTACTYSPDSRQWNCTTTKIASANKKNNTNSRNTGKRVNTTPSNNNTYYNKNNNNNYYNNNKNNNNNNKNRYTKNNSVNRKPRNTGNFLSADDVFKLFSRL